MPESLFPENNFFFDYMKIRISKDAVITYKDFIPGTL